MSRLESIFSNKLQIPSDINEHLVVLKEYASECSVVVELGVRGICSTWAFLSAKPDYLYSYDIYHPSYWGGNLSLVYDVAREEGVNFEFVLKDVLKTEIPECDLLFIDTWHCYDQLIREFELHSYKSKKYIILHDTETYGYKNEPNSHVNSFDYPLSGKQGLQLAISEFLQNNNDWEIHQSFTHNNGLTVLCRIG